MDDVFVAADVAVLLIGALINPRFEHMIDEIGLPRSSPKWPTATSTPDGLLTRTRRLDCLSLPLEG